MFKFRDIEIRIVVHIFVFQTSVSLLRNYLYVLV